MSVNWLQMRTVRNEPQMIVPFVSTGSASTRIVLELTSQVSMLKRMSLGKPFNDLPTQIAGFYEYKIQIHNDMIDMASSFMSGPKPGVGHGALAARAPQLTAGQG